MPFLAGILRNAVQRMNTDIQLIVVLVNDAYGFLPLTVVIDFFKPVETPDTVIDMGYIIAGFQVIHFLQGKRLFAAETFLQPEFVITIEQLVIGIAGNAKFFAYKAFV